jgi:hypothetical protein
MSLPQPAFLAWLSRQLPQGVRHLLGAVRRQIIQMPLDTYANWLRARVMTFEALKVPIVEN